MSLGFTFQSEKAVDRAKLSADAAQLFVTNLHTMRAVDLNLAGMAIHHGTTLHVSYALPDYFASTQRPPHPLIGFQIPQHNGMTLEHARFVVFTKRKAWEYNKMHDLPRIRVISTEAASSFD
jgi:hypothetical protein